MNLLVLATIATVASGQIQEIAKESPTQNGKEFWQISKAEYENRFKQRMDYNAVDNAIGYGPKSRFVPPLYKPKWMLSELDRFFLTLASNPLHSFISQGFIKGLGNGDSWDLFWYNNAEAAGSQMYPSGDAKYFDMYSYPGWVNYAFWYVWAWFCAALSPFTLFVPVNFWFRILEGDLVWDGFWKAFVPPMLSWFFHL